MLAPWCLLLQLVLGAAVALALQVRLVGVEGVACTSQHNIHYPAHYPNLFF